MVNKRGGHCLQMWVWDTKEHCVRAFKVTAWKHEIEEKKEGGETTVCKYTPLYENEQER